MECPSADVFMPELRQATPGVLLSKPHALEATGHRSHVRGYELEPLTFTLTFSLHVLLVIDCSIANTCLCSCVDTILLYVSYCAYISISPPSFTCAMSNGSHESGVPYSIVETRLDPEPRFDIADASGGHMSLPNLRLNKGKQKSGLDTLKEVIGT